jgi:hypothetical protein
VVTPHCGGRCLGKPFRVPEKVHKAQAAGAVTVHADETEEELQFISFLENSNDDLFKYSRAEVAELVASSGLGLSAGAAITLWRGARKKQLQQQHSHAVQADYCCRCPAELHENQHA